MTPANTGSTFGQSSEFAHYGDLMLLYIHTECGGTVGIDSDLPRQRYVLVQDALLARLLAQFY